jgi:beta-glucanase (GH16 family)
MRFSALAASLAAAAAAGSFCESPGFSLEWSDEFSAGALDASSWTVRNATAPNDSSCREAMCTSANVAVAGGELVLEARRESKGWAAYTTGAIDSQHKRSFGARPGAPVRFCIKGTVPQGAAPLAAGYWPAFWLMPDDASCWPDHGELDLMEMINGDGVEHWTYHVSAANASTCKGKDLSAGGNGPVPAGPHEYAVEVAMGNVAFAVDGAVVWRSNATALPVHDVPWYVILNFAIGKPWAQSPLPTTTFPARTTVDYVRVARGGGV